MQLTIAFLILDSSLYAEPPKKLQESQKLVQEALRSEYLGTSDKRNELVESALAMAQDYPSAHWMKGHIQSGKAWKSYSDLVMQSAKSKPLDDYRKLRDTSEPTLSSQLEMASYCRKHGLKQQAIAHWSAILEIETNHEEARKQLGFEWIDGQWMKSTQLQAELQRAKRISDAFHNSMPKLREIAVDLRLNKLNVKDAIELLSDKMDTDAIPALEACLSSVDSQGSATVIGLLENMPAPEATLSIARHAIWVSDPSVREHAIAILKNRDRFAYIPAMMRELRGPLLASREFIYDGANRLVCRYSLIADGVDKQSLKVLDENYFLSGIPILALNRAVTTANITSMQKESLRQSENRAIQLHNARISYVLQAVTGENGLESPQDWWNWWDDSNEVYSTEQKPLMASYAYRNSNIVGIPSELPTRDRSVNVRRTVTERKDCLAGGSLIRTQRGPIAIEKIRIGDLALAKHAVSGEISFQPVLRTTIREPEQLIRITVEGSKDSGDQTIRASGGHPFWVSGSGWVRARMLEPQMRLHGLDHFSTIAKVELEDRPARTFNLMVGEFHSYFVGNEAILSHDNSVIEPVQCKVPGLTN